MLHAHSVDFRKAVDYCKMVTSQTRLSERPQEKSIMTDMIYRPLGRTGLNVSIVGYGASPLGAEFGRIDPAEVPTEDVPSQFSH